MFLGTGWVAEGEGLTKVGVQATVLDVAVNGVPLTDTAAFWAAPTPADFPGQYVAYWAYPLGPVSRTFTVSFTWTLTHPVVDRVFLNANGSPFVYPSGVLLSGSCTVTVQ
jgi:hypothetical protein